MGFDIECIPNIQSLAGEYFCPVCRLLVYPNEALQSQCTHLYCKPCLAYIVSSTQACPYDGYLVTEADSKPLIESNKELAETIGKINVNCLYHRSGCTWQGTLVESTKHCSGCAFGNSPVVCNRCAIQIFHRQVLEHVQNCPGVQPQAQQAVASQDAAATGKITAVDKTQASAQGGTTTTNAQTSQTVTSSTPGQDLIQQGNSATHAQASVQVAVPTAEQLHQHQQYQQYYQQYPGYDPYQQQYQQYYPYQQQAVSQYQQAQVFMQPQPSQSQLQPQPQTQAQTQSQPQANNQQHVAAQALNQPQVNPQQQAQSMVQPQTQIQSSTHLTSHTHPLPLAQPHSQPYPIQTHTPHVQMAQQPHLQPQLQSQAHAQLHLQHHHPVPQPLTHMHAQHQPLPQPLVSQSKQPVNSNLQSLAQHPSAHSVTGHHYYPQTQSHQQMQLGALQNPLHMQPQGGPQPLSQPPAQMQNRYPQQPPLLRPPHFHNLQQPGLLPSPGQLPNIPPAQQHTNHQPGLPIPQRPVIQQQAMQSGPYVHQQHDVQSHSNPPSVTHAHLQQNVAFPHGQFHQALGPAKRPMGPVQGGEMQPHAQSAVGMQVTRLQVGANKQSGNIIKSDNQVQLPSDQPGYNSRPVSKNQVEKGGEVNDANDSDMTSDVGADVCGRRNIKPESDKPMGEAMGLTAPLPAGNGESIKEENTDHKDVANLDHKQFELPISDNKELKDGSLLNSPLKQAVNFEKQCTKLQGPNLTAHGSGASTPQMRGEGLMQPLHSVRLGRGKHHPPLNRYGPPDLQQRSSLVKGPPHHPQMPGHPLNQFSPLGPGQPPHLGQHLNLPSEHIQQPMYKQPYGPEISSGGIPGRVTASGPSHFGPPRGPYAEHNAPPSYREMFPDQRLNNTNGRRLEDSGVHLNAMRTPRFRDDRFEHFTDEHLSTFQMDSGQHIIGRLFEDQKHLPRPSYLEGEPGPKVGSQFSSSRPFEWFPRGFGIDGAPRPFDKGAHAQNFNSGLKLDSHGGSGFFPPSLLHPNDVGERLFGFHDVSGSNSRIHLDFLGKGPGYGHRNMDGFGLPSPDRCYPRITRRFDALSGIDDIDGRETRRFSDPVGSSFNDIRYMASPGHMQRGGFEGPSNFRMGDHLRTGGMIGPDGIPNHLQRNELLDPHNAPTQLHLGEPGGFIAFPGHDMRELAGPGNFHYPQVNEPGFRSRSSRKGFPGNGGSYTGDMKLVGSSKKRKHSSVGWCRICKVDCETVEGLDLHSQTREHQKMALDMVLAIKQNAKKQKIAPRDQSSVDDGASKPRDSSSEGIGNKD